ncbi:5942_t:CDS:2 [Ambispora gerdemannii]|uniref:5942_t:CDS:1 n=1 Tax=Ambispora gerdemannii TaxID=144530 RepID=A0A9N8V0I4_9GLOM|nr:5942_t:CDS:2 [Ambispora gerdemannii]
MTNQAQEHISQLTNHKRIKYLDISNRDLTGDADLKEFTALTSLNSYNNKFENLDFLNTLPNKEQLKKINFFGNQIKEIDLSHLLSAFPNLEYLNCENNPLRTVLLDLLEYAQKLVSGGNSSQQQNAQYLQALIQQGSSPIKPVDNKENGNNAPLLVGGAVVLAVVSALGIGYLIGKKRKQN